MSDCRLVVVSCPGREPIQALWKAAQRVHWPDCPFPVDVLSPTPDIGWNANLLAYLEGVSEGFVALFLDDHFLAESKPGEFTANITALLELMTDRPDIGMCKLQYGNAHSPEIPFPAWSILREYDRRHHPFKRTNLVPTLFRTGWLKRLSAAVLESCGPERDKGRSGALEFESTGTLLTKDTALWPEKMLGIHRPNPDGGGGQSLITCMDNDAVREGKLKKMAGREAVALEQMCVGVAGIEAFL